MPAGENSKPPFARYELIVPEQPPEEAIAALRGLTTQFDWQLLPSGQAPEQPLATPSTEDSEARLILRDHQSAALLTTGIEDSKYHESLAVFNRRVEDVTRPYQELFEDRMPPVSANKKSLLTRKPIEGRKGWIEWTYQETIGKTDLTYEHGLGFIQGRDRNQLRQVSMMFHTQKEALGLRRSECPNLSLGFTEGQLAKLTLQWAVGQATALYKLLAGSDAGNSIYRLLPHLPEVSSNPNIGKYSSKIDLDLARARLGIKSVLDSRKFYGRIAAEFRPSQDGNGTFTQIPEDEFRLAHYEQVYGVKLPESLTIDDYLEVIKSLLGLIPVIDLDKIDQGD